MLCWRKIEIDDSSLGDVAKSSEPSMHQVFVTKTTNMDQEKFKQQVLNSIPKLLFYVKSTNVAKSDEK